MNKKDINLKRVMIFALMFCLFIISVAYSVLAKDLNIKTIGSIDAKWDISITDIYSGDVVQNATNLFEPKIVSNSSVSFGTNLITPNDSITYTVIIENKGTIDAVLDSIIINENKDEKNSSIKYKVLGVEEKVTTLAVGEKNEVKILVYYDNIDVNSSTDLVTVNKKFSINFIYMQKGTN